METPTRPAQGARAEQCLEIAAGALERLAIEHVRRGGDLADVLIVEAAIDAAAAIIGHQRAHCPP